MSRLSELIAELCPDGVEYKQLQNVTTLQRGVRVVKKNLNTGTYPVYQNSLIPLGYYDKCNCDGGTAFIICAGAAGGAGFSKVDFWAADDCFYLERSAALDQKYAFYVLQSNQYKIDANVRRASIPRLPRWALDELVIPVPPLEVQREIVSVLDSFWELDDVLTAEIEAREKQFEKYRDELLEERLQKMCPDGVEYKALGEIAILEDYVANGSFASLKANVQYKTEPDYAVLVRVADYSSRFDKSSFKYVDKHAYDYLAKSSLEAGDVIISSVGSVGMVFECPDLGQPMTLGPNAIVLKSDYKKYLFHWLKCHDGQTALKGLSGQGTLPKINKTHLRGVHVPFPSIEVQREIVRILDSFQEHIEALRCERDARRKQFEHYRDRLLAFPEKVA